MKKIIVAATPFLFTVGCGGWACAQGPAEMESYDFTASAAQPVEESILFAEDHIGLFTSVSAEEAPEGIEVALTDDGVEISGAVDEPGTYSFSVRAEEKAGDACSSWARYDVTLVVE